MNALSPRKINELPKPLLRPVIGPGGEILVSSFHTPDASRLKA